MVLNSFPKTSCKIMEFGIEVNRKKSCAYKGIYSDFVQVPWLTTMSSMAMVLYHTIVLKHFHRKGSNNISRAQTSYVLVQCLHLGDIVLPVSHQCKCTRAFVARERMEGLYLLPYPDLLSALWKLAVSHVLVLDGNGRTTGPWVVPLP